LQQLEQKSDLVTLLQLLMYVKTLNYQTKRLKSNFRQFKFKLGDFLKYTGQISNHYPSKKNEKKNNFYY